MRARAALVVGAAAVLVSGYIHFYLYFRGGYRGIAPESFAGITISRSFALNAIAAVAIAEGLVCSLRWKWLATWASLAGIGFVASALVAYVLTRTTGLLGFSDDQTSTEAVIAVTAELVAMVALGTAIIASRNSRPTGAAASRA